MSDEMPHADARSSPSEVPQPESHSEIADSLHDLLRNWPSPEERADAAREEAELKDWFEQARATPE